jgi:hypothetical protein
MPDSIGGVVVNILWFLTVSGAFLYGMVQGWKKIAKIEIDRYDSGPDLMRTSPAQRRLGSCVLLATIYGGSLALVTAAGWAAFGVPRNLFTLDEDKTPPVAEAITTEKDFSKKYEGKKGKNRASHDKIAVKAHAPEYRYEVVEPKPTSVPRRGDNKAVVRQSDIEEKPSIRELYRD